MSSFQNGSSAGATERTPTVGSQKKAQWILLTYSERLFLLWHTGNLPAFLQLSGLSNYFWLRKYEWKSQVAPSGFQCTSWFSLPLLQGSWRGPQTGTGAMRSQQPVSRSPFLGTTVDFHERKINSYSVKAQEFGDGRLLCNSPS